MLTGLESLVVDVANSSVTRAAGWGAQKAVASRRTAKLRKLVAEIEQITNVSIGSTLSAEEIAEVGEFLHTPNFEHISYSLACTLIVEKSGRKVDDALEAVKQELSASLRAAAGHLASTVFSDAIFAALQYAVTKATSVLFTQRQSPRMQVAAARIIGSIAAASARNTDLLQASARIADFLVYENELRTQVRSLHGTMRIPHAGTTRQVPYEQLFIPPRLAFARMKESSLELDDLLASSTRSVILGDPGGGKSTLALKLAYDIASDSIQCTGARLPFLVVLRDYAEDNRGPKRVSIVQYLENLSRAPYAVDPPEGAIEYLLLNDRALVIFDGLDELTDTSLRRDIVQAVEGFAYRYPTTQIVVTSRRVGYEEAPLDPILFPVLQLMELSDKQVASYAHKWFALDEGLSVPERERLATGFLKDSSYVADLRINPLLLSLMCGIYATENYIPRNRPDVYEKCALLLFDRWDKQRGIKVPLSFDAHVYAAMRSLALHMYSQEQQQLNRQDLVKYIKGYLLKKRFDDPDIAETSAEEFIDFCKGRAWVLTDVGEEKYGFTHRTFLEYFSASQLVRLNPGAEPLFDTLRDRIASREWDTVAQLAVQILGRSVEDGADDFLRLTVECAPSAKPAAKANYVSFAARALQFIVPRPEVLRAIVASSIALFADRSVDLNWQPGYSGRYRKLKPSANAAAHLLGVAPELRGEVASLACEAISSRVAENWRQELLIAYGIAPWVLLDAGFEEGIRVDWDFMEAWAKGNWKELQPHIAKLGKKYFWVDLRRLGRGEIDLAELLDHHGAKALYDFNIAGYGPYAPISYELLMTGRLSGSLWFGARINRALRSSLLESLEVLLPALPTPWFQYLRRYIILSDAIYWGPQVIKSLSDQLILLLSAPLVEIQFRENESLASDPAREAREGAGQTARDWNRLFGVLKLRTKADVVEEDLAAALAQVSLSQEAEDLLRRWILHEVDLVARRRLRKRPVASAVEDVVPGGDEN